MGNEAIKEKIKETILALSEHIDEEVKHSEQVVGPETLWEIIRLNFLTQFYNDTGDAQKNKELLKVYTESLKAFKKYKIQVGIEYPILAKHKERFYSILKINEPYDCYFKNLYDIGALEKMRVFKNSMYITAIFKEIPEYLGGN